MFGVLRKGKVIGISVEKIEGFRMGRLGFFFFNGTKMKRICFCFYMNWLLFLFYLVREGVGFRIL